MYAESDGWGSRARRRHQHREESRCSTSMAAPTTRRRASNRLRHEVSPLPYRHRSIGPAARGVVASSAPTPSPHIPHGIGSPCTTGAAITRCALSTRWASPTCSTNAATSKRRNPTVSRSFAPPSTPMASPPGRSLFADLLHSLVDTRGSLRAHTPQTPLPYAHTLSNRTPGSRRARLGAGVGCRRPSV
jgi:hypothetical protein